MMDFYDLPTARHRLTDSVVRLDSEPFIITNVESDNRDYLLFGAVCSSNPPPIKTIPLKHKKLDFTPIPLGFVNRNKTIVQLSREPRRMWKVGLNAENVAARILTAEGLLYDHIDFIATVLSDSFYDSVMGKFPTVSAILDTKAQSWSKAFSRDWGIKKLVTDDKPKLVHKFHGFVGEMNGLHPELKNEFQFLHEALMEDFKE